MVVNNGPERMEAKFLAECWCTRLIGRFFHTVNGFRSDSWLLGMYTGLQPTACYSNEVEVTLYTKTTERLHSYLLLSIPPPKSPQSNHSTTWQPPSFEIWTTSHLSLPSFSNFQSHFRVKIKTYMEIRWSLRFHVKLESSFDSLKLRFLQSWKLSGTSWPNF